ncbi:MAG: transcriptional regulator [Kaiparowitsia implicata GSE-PSE-MK54-09C]|jgi:predicted ArsR family transcriptional regulator|nr:transcriptional regulator [Kaiparowitsia implicata GSE-PSE-MK54-09C]
MGDRKHTPKDDILNLLKRQGPQTATALAEALGVSPMAIRQHLQRLKADGWVRFEDEHQRMGRPAKRWHLTSSSMQRFPDSHADLTLELLRGVEAVFGSEGLDQIVAERQQRQVQSYQTQLEPIEDWRARIWAIAQIRSQEGYMAEVITESPQAMLLVENHCPICTAAQTCQGLCSAELAVFRTVLGNTVTVERVEHILQGDRRCAYRICSTAAS